MSGKKVKFKTVKIKEEHYLLAKKQKQEEGINIEFFIGKAIEEYLKKHKK